MQEDYDWRENALCANVDEIQKQYFFSDNIHEVKEAQSICKECSVRRECLSFALQHEDRFGVWGGANEGEIRRALSIDVNGFAIQRTRPIRCPLCKSIDIDVLEKRRNRSHVQCAVESCRFNWWTRKSSLKRGITKKAT